MLQDAIATWSEHRNASYLSDVRPRVASYALPNDYYRIVGHADGFIVRDATFRFFGLTATGQLPSIEQWNAEPWIAEYRELTKDIVFVAEDLFGDQYGFSFR